MLSELKKLDFYTPSILFPSKTLHLHSMLVNCGHQYVDSEQYNFNGMNRGRREMAIWQYTIEGSGRLTIGNKEYELNPGNAMMVHVPQEHCYFLPPGGQWEFVFVSFNGSELMRLWDEAEKRIGSVAHFSEDSKTLAAFLEIFNSFKSGLIDNPFSASMSAYKFVMSIFEDHQVEEAGNPVPTFIKTVVDFCMEHISDPLNVDDMAEAAGYSRYHFTRLFKKSQGMSPALFLKQLKLKQAERLLQTELLTVNEIADRCGFDDSSYFCKVFREEYGHSPGEYRNTPDHEYH
ncbi:MAG: hypothetical protein A2020_09295 [Lentisphaerae bacterium GWF2_45_14]|nr:MAG: hypothetical protein A2020_09295 [Lentisphaerae bacterium GWF2_45_14]